jgi:hypothetical protein
MQGAYALPAIQGTVLGEVYPSELPDDLMGYLVAKGHPLSKDVVKRIGRAKESHNKRTQHLRQYL